MNLRKSAAALGFAVAFATPLAALAGGIWESTNDEAGSRIVNPQPGSAYLGALQAGAMNEGATARRVGEISADRIYVYHGDEGGWQLRPMQYLHQGGHFMHVDDPAGHMHRLADDAPPTAAERAALDRPGSN